MGVLRWERKEGRFRKWPVKTGTKVHRIPKESSLEEPETRLSDKFDHVKNYWLIKSWIITTKK